ncbi:response regulator transcription factor [Aggregatilinea lenta]|uniref:response regulator transcription factor n=1 Tax=Aggregatilinea lenta TaxID=913108 RepID=UPI000E5B1BC1|nr:response regulator transcription factor [Aggregatilinea lenta]
MASNGEDAYILVVDDEGAIRYSISKTLQRVGYQVQTASSGEEALDMMQQQDYDVVLTDIRMPGLSGVELLAKIKERAPDAVVILLTGYANLESAIESLRLGAHDYLTKPSSSQSIRDSVAQGLERARNLKSRRVLLRTIQENVEALAGEAANEAAGTAQHASETSPSSTPVVTPVTTMTIGPLTIFPGRYQISVGDQPIDLTPTEFDLLLYLAAHRGRVVPCSELVREVRGYTLEEHEAREVIRPHVSNLRRKLKSSGQNPNIIVNVRGIGYRLSEPS